MRPRTVIFVMEIKTNAPLTVLRKLTNDEICLVGDQMEGYLVEILQVDANLKKEN